MHSIYSRANSLSAFTMSTLSAVTMAVFLSTVLLNPRSSVDLSTSNVRVRSVVDYASETEKSDLGLMDISIHADLSSVFNWNVKELFVYLVAEYGSNNGETLNQVVLWDKVVLRGERVVLDERRTSLKYYFLDEAQSLLNHQNVTLVLRWNVIPNAGYLRLAEGSGQHVVQFPSTYAPK